MKIDRQVRDELTTLASRDALLEAHAIDLDHERATDLKAGGRSPVVGRAMTRGRSPRRRMRGLNSHMGVSLSNGAAKTVTRVLRVVVKWER
jgi:hypothetical protein